MKKGTVDFVVENKPVTEADRKRMSEIIALYKTTGKKVTIIGGATIDRPSSPLRKTKFIKTK